MTDVNKNRESPPIEAVNEAVSLLNKLGLTKYAARTFLTLYRISGGTARDVSDSSSVPRTKVYDAVEELQDYGLVEVRRNNPQEFFPTSKETTRRRFQREYERAVTDLFEILDTFPPLDGNQRVDGVWVSKGKDSVAGRAVELIDDATESVVFVAVDGDVPRSIGRAICAAVRRGVDVTIGGVEDPFDDPSEDAIEEISVVPSAGIWSGSAIKSFLFVGERAVLVISSGDGQPSGLWGKGSQNVLVTTYLPVLKSWQSSNTAH
ncbi:TrmB family transcriptional regulator [Haloarchaeobius sp. DFWS5]|uniref:TrmB family transcriptional regulator n=1 Tax=Haloarchaeobius sp. DFWS5 TaxID=3446114 RepID=UPI003EBBE7A4